MLLQLLLKLRNTVDRKLKFPNVKKGDVVIQVGFDMSSPNLTTDLFMLQQAVGNTGVAIGVDPDPLNIERARKVIDSRNLNVLLVQKATFNEKGSGEIIMGRSAANNMLDCIPTDITGALTDEKIMVEFDTLDNIVEELGIDKKAITFINITNNGAEYATVQGMKRILKNASNLEMNLIAGRKGTIGVIEGRSDVDMISDFLKREGYRSKFYRINQLLWSWINHFHIIKALLKFKYDRKMMGVVFVARKDKLFKFYRSFS